MNTIINNRLTTFLLHLELLDTNARRDAVVMEAIETGGTYIVPASDDTWASHLFELELHGIHATGTTEEEVIRSWVKAASRQTPPGGAPTIATYDGDQQLRQMMGGLLA